MPMSYERHADYSEISFLPCAVEDWVGEDHPARFVRAFVEALDLKELGFRTRRRPVGAPSFSSDVLLKAWIYGYLRKITSSRRLEEACMENMGLIWLLGRLEPDHVTLWRFWRDSREAIGRLFKQSVRVAAEMGLTGLTLHALDSTKIKAASSRRGASFKKDLETALAQVDKRVEEIESQIVEAEKREEGEYRLDAEVAELAGKRDAIQAALKKLEEHETNQLHPKEDEARLMKAGARGALEFGYSNQAVIDEENGIVVACDTNAEASDVNQLNPMLDQVEETLGQVSDLTVADNNYAQSEKELAQAEQAGRDVVMPRPSAEKEPFHPANFRADVEKRTCVCPLGQELRFCGIDRRSQAGTDYLCFECPFAGQCPEREKCASFRKDKWRRRVKIGIHRAAADNQRRKQSEARCREALHLRKQLIEPYFGWAKQDFGLRRFTFKGLKSTKAQWSMVCLTWNLMKMMKARGPNGDRWNAIVAACRGRLASIPGFPPPIRV
jgi:transposase